jgi:ankyrin repeat protein
MSLVEVQTRYEDLKRHAAQAKETTDTLEIFEAVINGDALNAYSRLSSDADLHIKQDEHRMTPLHHASADHSGLMIRILINTPNAAPIMRDEYDRTPLDVAIENDNQIGQEILFPITFALQFLQAELSEARNKNNWLDNVLEGHANAQATYQRQDRKRNPRDQSQER